MKSNLICLFLCAANMLTALSPSQAHESPDKPRILELIPNLVSPLGVEVAIPSNFVPMSPNGMVDPCDWIYWGPKDTLEAYFKNPADLQSPVIRVKLSTDMGQTQMGSLDVQAAQMRRNMPAEFEVTQLKWGEYPVVAVRGKINNRAVLTAWVGLNAAESGVTLIFNLVYPDETAPNQTALALWNEFLHNTRQLSDYELFKAAGQDLQPGYTIVTAGLGKLKMTAEKRQRDGSIQVVVVPMQPEVTFKFLDLEEGLMGSKYKYGEPLVKVYGTTTNKAAGIVMNHVTSILIESVTEFSVNKDDSNATQGMLIFQKQGGQTDDS